MIYRKTVVLLPRIILTGTES